MTEPAPAAAASERPFLARFLNRAIGFWTGPSRRNAWLWTTGALALVFANLAFNAAICACRLAADCDGDRPIHQRYR